MDPRLYEMDVASAPEDDLRRRMRHLQKELARNQLDGAFVMSIPNRYFFGGIVQMGLIYIPVGGGAWYFVKRGEDRVKQISPLDNVVTFDRYGDLPELMSERGLRIPKNIGLEMDTIPVSVYQRLKRYFDLIPADISRNILGLRKIKSEHEIAQIRKAAEVVDSAIGNVPEYLKEGMTELELQAKIEYDMRMAGHPGEVRSHGWDREFTPGITLAGRTGAFGSYVDTVLGGKGLNNAMPAGPSSERINKNEPVIADFAGSHNGYYADMTRTFCVGELEEKIQKGYEWCKEFQYRIVSRISEGRSLSEVSRWAFRKAKEEGYGKQFMGVGRDKVSFLGHGVGLELDEFPIVFAGWDECALPGEVIAIEPKLIFPDVGAVGVENTWFAEKEGASVKLECLTDTEYYL